MSIYDREANGRGRYDESVFVGGTKISAGPMEYWRDQTRRQWLADGEPDREQDPANPYFALQTYKTLVCARTVAELDRLIESAKWAGWYYGWGSVTQRPKKFDAYRLYWSWKRQAKALDRVFYKLNCIRGHINAAIEETGYIPYGVTEEGRIMGYRQRTDSNKADESLVALLAMD